MICVDDEPTVLDSLKIELRRSLGNAYLIEMAEGGSEALELLEELQSDQNPVAVVVADYVMPGIKGDELLRQIHVRSPHTINIMLSGQADLDAVSRAIESANLYRFITKPWHPDDLSLTIAEALNSYAQARQLELQHQELHRLNQELQQFNQNLEAQVQERTAELKKAIQELQILNQLKDDFSHAVSHDLRTPVTGMLMVLRRLQNRSESVITLDRTILDRLVHSSEHQLNLLEAMMEAHFSEIHGIKLHCQPISLDPFAHQLTQGLEELTRSYDTHLQADIAPEIPLVMVDPVQLRRVYENLITNAYKHNPPGITIRLQAELEPGHEHTWVRCWVSDTGKGVADEECDQLFDRYRQGKNRIRQSVGLGLGLYLCRQIILEHGGEIGARNAPEGGLQIWFTLPIATGVPA